MTSALNEWNVNPDQETLAYHERQWDQVYGSTIEFARFVEPLILESSCVLDLGCGAGSSTTYLAETFPDTHFTGADVSETLIDIAHDKSGPIKNVKFIVGNMCNMHGQRNVDGVVSLQTLSWMPDIESPLTEICTKINPQWLAFSSLFYDGEISCNIVVNEATRPRKSYYNIYSIPEVCRILARYGYKKTYSWRFNIKDDLPKPDNPDLMKTYTQRTRDGFRNQFSGPLYLPWYFLAFEKSQ